MFLKSMPWTWKCANWTAKIFYVQC